MIIHILNLKGLGGVQKNFITYFNKLNKINADKNNHYLFYLNIDKKNLIKKNVYNLKKIRDIFFLLKLIFFRKSKICIYNRIGSFRLLMFLILFFFKIIIVHERGVAYNINSFIGQLIVKINSLLINKIITNSNATKILLQKKFSINKIKIITVHNGFEILNNDIKPEFKTNNKFTVGFCGRFEIPKNPLKFVEIANYSKANNSLKFIMIGNGSLYNLIKFKSKKINNLEILKSQYNLKEFYKKIDLLIVPSIREPFGNVIIEAGINMVPVIASNVDGIPEIIENHHNGLLINPKNKIDKSLYLKNLKLFPKFVVNPNTLDLNEPLEISTHECYNSILKIKDNKKFREKYTYNMKEIIREKFSIESYINKTNEIYSHL